MEGARFRKNVEDFLCEHCGADVKGNGFTDHCPKCLWSKHVDIMPGDRLSDCRGMMKPVGAEYDRKGYSILYRCMKCGMEKRMRAAENDDMELILSLLQTV
ncbi:MAG: RNHCP domain-containing protein [Candidatus Micrarchaeota archaeon]|nr:RNHCP domain-containing protein [Candidatus Micrarchaeota archaeon]